jgi:hypothetical protein
VLEKERGGLSQREDPSKRVGCAVPFTRYVRLQQNGVSANCAAIWQFNPRVGEHTHRLRVRVPRALVCASKSRIWKSISTLTRSRPETSRERRSFAGLIERAPSQHEIRGAPAAWSEHRRRPRRNSYEHTATTLIAWCKRICLAIPSSFCADCPSFAAGSIAAGHPRSSSSH